MTQREREKVLAQRNKWPCYENGRFTWFFSACPKMGTSECPASMLHDRKCEVEHARQ